MYSGSGLFSFMKYEITTKESWYVNFSMRTQISASGTRLCLSSKMKNHNILHINILLFKETTAYRMHHARPFLVMTRSSGVQFQVWRQLSLLSTVKIYNFFHIHLLLPYRVTEVDAISHSWPPRVMTHSSRYRTISRRCVFLVMIVRSNWTWRAQKDTSRGCLRRGYYER